jgi:D-alanyl-D-alanine carboxypeptidase (penicillin-binding protein 5/6)
MQRGRALVIAAGLALVVAAVTYGAVSLTRGVPRVDLVAAHLPQDFPGHAGGLDWPTQGEAAVAVQGVGLLGSHRSDQVVPIASVAKIMTAFLILRDHPLPAGRSGPRIRVTGEDEAVYQADRATGQSTAAVRSGEELTERQALEALLLPSANNVATLLARWDAGSEDAFVGRMNAQARALGMVHTHYSDASGFSTATVSAARDQVRLASAAVRRPALVQIATLRRVHLPVAGDLENLDDLLGSHGVFGIKTGSTSAAGGCFVFAARVPVDGRRVTVVGAALGQPGVGEREQLDSAFDATTHLLLSARRMLVGFGPVVRRRVFGRVVSAWARPVPVRLLRVPALVGWPGLPVRIAVHAASGLRAPVDVGQVVGSVTVEAGQQRVSAPLVASGSLSEPSVGWRLTHP